MTLKQIKDKASDWDKNTRWCEVVLEGKKPVRARIIGIGSKYVRLMWQDGGKSFVEPTLPVFVTAVW